MVTNIESGFAQSQSPVNLPLNPQDWQEIKVDESLKRNEFRFSIQDQTPMVEIYSDTSMSLIARPLSVDLQQTPVLCWRWRVNRVIDKADLNERSGDDYAARVYLSFVIPDDEKSLALKIQLGLARSIWGDTVPDGAINYVWDNRHKVDTYQPNAYTDRIMMVVAQSGPQKVGQWVWQRRHVGHDMKKFFTPSAKPIQIALAADTDNTAETVQASFANIRFVDEQTSCPP